MNGTKINEREYIMKDNSSQISKADWDAVESPPLSEEMLSKMKTHNTNLIS